MARRSSFASGPENFAATMARRMACSWNSGTPRVLPSTCFSSSAGPWSGCGEGNSTASSPQRRRKIGVHHVALDGAWPHDRHLDDEVVEFAGLQPRQHVHLRPALDLEHADRIRLAQHVVNGGIVGRHGAERKLAAVMLLDQGEALADAGEHAEAEHIDFKQPERIEVVLVPFDEGAVLHGGVADGHDLGQAARASARSRRHAGRDGAGSRAALA